MLKNIKGAERKVKKAFMWRMKRGQGKCVEIPSCPGLLCQVN
jgi:hypothetical protein